MSDIAGHLPVTATEVERWAAVHAQIRHARRRALIVLDHGHRHSQPVRVSNATTAPDQLDGDLTVYWQAAEWLIARGYTRVRGDVLLLTDAGHQTRQQIEGTRG